MFESRYKWPVLLLKTLVYFNLKSFIQQWSEFELRDIVLLKKHRKILQIHTNKLNIQWTVAQGVVIFCGASNGMKLVKWNKLEGLNSAHNGLLAIAFKYQAQHIFSHTTNFFLADFVHLCNLFKNWIMLTTVILLLLCT